MCHYLSFFPRPAARNMPPHAKLVAWWCTDPCICIGQMIHSYLETGELIYYGQTSHTLVCQWTPEKRGVGTLHWVNLLLPRLVALEHSVVFFLSVAPSLFFFLIHIFHKNERSISLSPRQFFISYITLLVFQRYVVVRISQYGASSNNCCHLTCDLNCARSLPKKKQQQNQKWTTTTMVFTSDLFNKYTTNVRHRALI